MTENPPNELKWSPEGLEKLFKTLVEMNCFPNELGAVGLRSGQKLSEEELKAYRYLCAFARAETRFKANAQLIDHQFPGLPDASKYLRSFNIWTELQPDNSLKHIVPKFVRHEIENDLVLTLAMIDHSRRLEESVIPAINMSMTRFNSTSFVPVLEALMSADLVDKSGIEELVASCSTKLNPWTGNGPRINPNGVLTVEGLRENVINQNFDSRMVKPADLVVLLENIAVGDAFVCKPKSSSAM